MSLTCYVLDDEYHHVELLISYIERTDGLELKGFSTNPLTALNEVAGGDPPDILFLDIAMPELSGLEFADLVNLYTTVIFTTSFQEYAFDAFEKEAFSFLLKPIGYGRFRKAVQQIERIRLLVRPVKERQKFFFVTNGRKGKMDMVAIDDILYVEGAKNYVIIHKIKNEKVMPYLTLQEVEHFLPGDQFIRIHQSFIVNICRIRSVEHNHVILEETIKLNIGRLYREPFMEKMQGFLLKTHRKL